ncbi:hypothetical protein [Prescottella equi]|nr:hypothetical protein [Prescottella equi]
MSDLYRLMSKSWQPPGTRNRITRGTVFTPPENQLERLLRIGAIVPVDDELDSGDSDSQSDPLADDEPGDRQGRDDDPNATDYSDSPDTSPAEAVAGADGQSQDVVERPKQAAAKAVWVEYAVARGMDRDEADGLDKRELIAALP